MRILYERHVGNVGYSPDDFRSIVEEVSGNDLTEWFAHYIDGVDEFDYAKSLDWYGLEFSKPKSSSDKTDSTSEVEKSTEKQKAWVGLTTEDKSGRLVITKVLRDSPAFEAGLNVADEILAIDQYRVTVANWSTRLKQYQPGESVEVTIARRELIQRLRLALGEEPSAAWKIAVAKESSDEQKQQFKAWLHQE